jgi:hypothetical protein
MATSIRGGWGSFKDDLYRVCACTKISKTTDKNVLYLSLTVGGWGGGGGGGYRAKPPITLEQTGLKTTRP